MVDRLIISVPDSGLSVVDTEGADSFDLVESVEFQQVAEFLNQQLVGSDNRNGLVAAQLVERVARVQSGADTGGVVVAAYHGHSSYARGISGLLVGEKVGDTLVAQDIVINPARQGAGPRVKGLLKCAAARTGASKVDLVCEENDLKFFSQMLPGTTPNKFEEDGETLYQFYAPVESLG